MFFTCRTKADRDRMVAQMRSIVTTAQKEGRADLTPAEAQRFEALDEAIQKWATRKKPTPEELSKFEKMNTTISNPHEQRGKAFMEGAKHTQSTNVKFDTRAVMTPEAASAGEAMVKSTAASIYAQNTSSAAFLSAMSLTETENNRTFPFLDRTDRLTAQNKALTDALTKQAFVISGYTVGLHNYYAHPVWHNDVARDAASDIGAFIFDAAAQDIRRQIASDVLFGDGSSNNITGLDNYSGVQSLAVDNELTGWTKVIEATQKLYDKNIDPSNISVVMSPGGWASIQRLAATDNQPLLPPDGLNFANIFVTSLIPDNLGTGTNESVIFVGDLSKVQLFMDGMYTINASQRYAELDHNSAVLCMRADMQSFEPDHLIKLTGIQVSDLVLT